MPQWANDALEEVRRIEMETTGGGVNALVLLGMLGVMLSGGVLRAITTAFDRVVWVIERRRESRSRAETRTPFEAKEVPSSDSRLKLVATLGITGVLCLVTLAVMNP